ncbi:tetratricopeptide repeat protein [Streptomyces sp. NPDC088810]|uniref:tetratricopeptide repeat protein n=1 Tax=Streptomyces sp. NPDC088810 TaxID=3365904 RepID=UPI00380D8DF2
MAVDGWSPPSCRSWPATTCSALAIEERVVVDSERVLGRNHPAPLTARADRALSYRQAGRTDETVRLLTQVVADRERHLGADRPGSVAARRTLVTWRRDA